MVKGLTGVHAARRLERRGGDVLIRRPDQGGAMVRYDLIRRNGVAVVTAREYDGLPSATHTPKVVRKKQFTLKEDADRVALAAHMDATLASVNAAALSSRERFELDHHDILELDPGWMQFGCFVVLGSAVVGGLIGLVGGWFATETIDALAVFIGPALGVVVGFFGLGVVAGPVVDIPAVRDRIEAFAFGWFLVTPAVVAAAVMIALTIGSAAGGSASPGT